MGGNPDRTRFRAGFLLGGTCDKVLTAIDTYGFREAVWRKVLWSNMPGKSVTFNSALAAEAVRDALLRSVSTQGVPPYLEPWFYRMHRKGDQTRPVWGVVGTQKFGLRRSSGGAYAPNFYATWEPRSGGSRIDGYFDLGPIERLTLRITLVVMLALSVIGVLLNALDLTRGTHFTNSPQFGLVLSILFVPYCIGFYVFVQKRGSRSDDRLLAFIETTLAARLTDSWEK